jgi:hypothetical protein
MIINYGNRLLIINIMLMSLIFSPDLLLVLLLFWKGVLWAAKAAKVGYQWKVGDGERVKFWEDQLFGTSSLAIQYWEVYCLANEHNCSISELWDDTNLKITFRRCFDHNLML